jgi:hypothetical protein
MEQKKTSTMMVTKGHKGNNVVMDSKICRVDWPDGHWLPEMQFSSAIFLLTSDAKSI